MNARTTIYIEGELLVGLKKHIPERGLSRLVNTLLAERLAQLDRMALEAEMREGYLDTARDREELNADWQTVDGELWP